MKFYTKPEIEISVFATEDIITASGDGNDDPVITASLENGGALTNDTTDAIDFNTIDWTQIY